MNNIIILARTPKQFYNDKSGEYAYSGDWLDIMIAGPVDEELIREIEDAAIELKKIARKHSDLHITKYVRVDWSTFAYFCTKRKRQPMHPASFFQLEIPIAKRCTIFLQSPPVNFDYQSFLKMAVK